MRVVICARHIDLSDRVKAYAQEKVGKLERFMEEVAQAELVLTSEFHGRRESSAPAVGAHDQRSGPAPADGLAASEPPQQEPAGRAEKPEEGSGGVGAAELVVSIAREHAPFVAHAKGEHLCAAIDIVVDKMERQLRKYKEKLKDRHRSGGTPR